MWWRGPSTWPTRRASTTRSWCSSATASSRPSSTGTTTRASTSKGKTLVMLVNDPPVPIPPNPGELDPKTFGGKAMTYYGRWTYKYEIGAAEGRGRRADRPRDRTGRLPLQRRAGQQDRRAVRSRHARQEHGPRGHRRLDHARPGEGAAADGRPGFRRAEEAGGDARLQAGAARRDRVDDDSQHAADDRLAQRRREARRLRSRR